MCILYWYIKVIIIRNFTVLHIHCTLCSIISTVRCTVLYILYGVQYYIPCTVYSIISTVRCTVLYPLYSVQYYIHCTVYSTISTERCTVLYQLYGVQYYIHCTVYSTLSTVRCTALYGASSCLLRGTSGTEKLRGGLDPSPENILQSSSKLRTSAQDCRDGVRFSRSREPGPANADLRAKPNI